MVKTARPTAVRVILLTALLLGACTSLGAAASGERLERMRKSPQYNGEAFVNKLPQVNGSKNKKKRGLIDALGMIKKFADRDAKLSPKEPLQTAKLVPSDFGAPATGLTVRWFGHSSVLIEIEGTRILTDPIWSERASPVGFAGPKRFTPPLIALDALPRLDAVIISHDHYDHLDTATIQALTKQEQLIFFVPLGVGAHLEAWGVEPRRIRELDWWQEGDVNGIRVICTPARHFSGRSLDDRNETLWASWSIVGAERRAFFSGDTGLHPDFEEIGNRYGPFDITLLESGAYNERWADVHMGPEQAVIAHRALRGKIMVPIHWGLFNLSLHSWVEPIERLRVIAKRDGDLIAQPRPGALVAAGQALPAEQWWPKAPWLTAEQSPVWSSNIDPTWLARYWPAKPAEKHAARGPAGAVSVPD